MEPPIQPKVAIYKTNYIRKDGTTKTYEKKYIPSNGKRGRKPSLKNQIKAKIDTLDDEKLQALSKFLEL
jgi:D-alanine-D-alanine ligase-like ATP-grasp enzyme